MLINRYNDPLLAAQEVEALTGSYYASNDFIRLQTDWLLAEENTQKLVGKAVIDRAAAWYHADDYIPYPDTDATESGSADQQSDIDSQLVQHLQTVIAFTATFEYYQSNLISHEDSGRKVKIDNQNEKMAWEWMLDRDDQAQLKKIHSLTDRLINFLEENQISEWLASEQRKTTRELFVNTTAIFQLAYPIDDSPRFYYTVTPFVREVQNRTIKKALGPLFSSLLNYYQSPVIAASSSGSGSSQSGLPADDTNEYYDQLIDQVQKVIPLLTMIIAIKRLSLKALPWGVVQQFMSQFTARNASQAPASTAIADYCSVLQSEADYALDDIKRIISEHNATLSEYQFLPKNSQTNKFFRT